MIMSQKHIALGPFIHLTPQYLSLLIQVAFQPMENVESRNLPNNCYLLFWLLLASFLFLLCAFWSWGNLGEHDFGYTFEGFTSSSDGSFVGSSEWLSGTCICYIIQFKLCSTYFSQNHWRCVDDDLSKLLFQVVSIGEIVGIFLKMILLNKFIWQKRPHLKFSLLLLLPQPPPLLLEAA